jgi:hypothetical protein
MTYFNWKYPIDPWTGCGPWTNLAQKADVTVVFQNALVKLFNVSQACQIVSRSGGGGSLFLQETADFIANANCVLSDNPVLRREAAEPLCKYSEVTLTIKPFVYEKNITTTG